ncbi:MAG: Rap1a/Tai family immunity protein [Gammaproteobacteria bacterium]
MKPIILLIIFFFNFFLIPTANAYSGEELLEDCKKSVEWVDGASPNNSNYTMGINTSLTRCSSYIRGMIDMQTTYSYAFEYSSKGSQSNDEYKKYYIFCIPSGVNILQVTRVLIKSLESTPELLHANASTLASLALIKAFPCEKSDENHPDKFTPQTLNKEHPSP